MKILAEKIYENYLKPREKTYSLSNDESNLFKLQAEFESKLSLSSRLKYEEILFLMSKLKHQQSLELVEFVINELNKKEDN